jgi:hypothetical protein
VSDSIEIKTITTNNQYLDRLMRSQDSSKYHLSNPADRKEHNSVFAQSAPTAPSPSSPKDEERMVARDEYADNAHNLIPLPNAPRNPDEIQRSIYACKLIPTSKLEEISSESKKSIC